MCALEETKKKRDLTFDIARALCMMWIIGVWHVLDYIEYNNVEAKNNLEKVTICVLASFTYISGFFLGKKRISARQFYLNRLQRLYPLFFVASTLLLFIGWYSDKKQYIFTLTGLSNFILPQPLTLWYVCMLLLLYLVTPFLIYRGDKSKCNPSILIVARGTIFAALLFLLLKIGLIDERIPFYSIFYILGLSTPLCLYQRLVRRRFEILFVGIIYIVLCLVHKDWWQFFPYIGILLIIVASSVLRSVSSPLMGRIWFIISYSSMCAYLFHRQIYWCFVYFFGIDVFLIPIIVVTILFASYIIQRLYDTYIMPHFLGNLKQN